MGPKVGDDQALADECTGWPCGWLRPRSAPWSHCARRQAADTVFIVANYPVEARADNAVAAKTQALADGQQAAFRSLLKRLVPVTAYPRIRKLASVKAGDLIDGYKVRSERNSATEYIASLDFSFQSKAVRDLLRREGIPFSDEQAPAITVIPVWRDGPGGAPRDDPAWTNVWKGLDLEHALTPVTLQTLRKEIQPSTISALAGGDGSAMRSLAGAYRSEYVVIAVGRVRPRRRAPQHHPGWPRRRRRLHACRAPIASMRPIPATPTSLPPWWRSASSRDAGRPPRSAAAAAAEARLQRAAAPIC